MLVLAGFRLWGYRWCVLKVPYGRSQRLKKPESSFDRVFRVVLGVLQVLTLNPKL